MIQATFWALCGAMVAVGVEVLYRKGVVWESHLYIFLPAAVAVNYAVYRLVSGGPTLIVAVAMFSLGTLLLRMGASQWLLGEPLARGNLAAAVALGVGLVLGWTWK